MNWIMVLLVAAGALSLLRIFSQVRRATRTSKVGDWDERFIGQLRKAGIAPFESYPVDFLFELPTAAACAEVTAELVADGYVVDSHQESDGGAFSLHANRSMRLLVPEMQALTARFRALAEGKGGKYDGWAVAKKQLP